MITQTPTARRPPAMAGQRLRVGALLGCGAALAWSGPGTASPTVAGQSASVSSGTPGVVADLRVISSTDRSLTVRFTEVEDGDGRPSDYMLSFLAGSSGAPWSEGTAVRTGSCGGRLDGRTVGRERSCVIEGLEPSRTYRVQVVAFRSGDPGVFGAPSDPAAGRTGTATGRPGAAPSALELAVGESHQMSAEWLDPAGVPIDHPVSWISSRSAVASVSRSGLVVGRAPGRATLRATVNATDYRIPVTVRAAGPAPSTPVSGSRVTGTRSLETHEPPGFRAILDHAFSSLTEGGWGLQIQNRHTTIEEDPTAPASPPYVIRHYWPRGCGSGTSCNNWVEAPNWEEASDEVYVRLTFKYSRDWQGHDGSGINKLFYLSMAGYEGNVMAVNVYGQRQGRMTFRPTVQSQSHAPCGIEDTARNLHPNTGASAQIRRGEWHQLELHLKTNTPGRCDGVFRAWVDGRLTHDYSPGNRSSEPSQRGVVYIDPGDRWRLWNRTHENPIWGGGTGYRAERAMWILKDHLYVSIP